jgi:ATP-binding cassette subfamily B protein
MLVEALEAQVTLKDAGAEAATARKIAQIVAAPPDRGPALLGPVSGGLFLLNTVVLWYGAVLVLGEQLTVGGLLAVQLLVGLAAVPLLRWAGLGPRLCTMLFVQRKLAEAEETRAAKDPPAEPLPPVRGHLRIEDVSFRYHPESPNVLSRINLAFQPGQVVALLGRSGAGKSTLALLLARFYLPTEGTIRLDGFDLAGVEVRTLHAQVSVVNRESVLVTGTVRDNISLGDPDAAWERVVEAARLAGAHEFISSLPRSYDAVIGPGGLTLSAGQRMGVCLARAFLKEPRLLILDDVLGELDAESERALVKNLRAGARGRTTLLLSRRPLPAAYADWIVVLEAGQVVEAGSHRELLEQKGLYYYWTGLG